MAHIISKKGLGRDGDNEETSLDIKLLIRKVISYWRYLIASIAIGLIIAFLINHYSPNVYKVQSSVLINGEEQADVIGLMESMGQVNSTSKFYNELIKIKSRKITEKALNKLDFEIIYEKLDFLNTEEIYPNPYFKIIFDSTHEQLVNSPFTLKKEGNSKLKISWIDEPKGLKDGNLENLDMAKYPPNNKEFIKLDQWISSPYFKFKVVASKEWKKLDFPVQFTLLDNNFLIKKYREELKIKPASERSSVINIALKGTNKEKIKSFTDTLVSVYIKSGLKNKNKRSKQTINFIEKELDNIADSLNQAESTLLRYQTANKAIAMTERSVKLQEKAFELDKEKQNILYKKEYLNYLEKYLQDKKSLDSLISPGIVEIENSSVNNLVEKLSELYSERSSIKLDVAEINPILNKINSQISTIKKLLKERIKNQKEAINRSLQNINNEIVKLELRLQDLPQTKMKLINIKRKYNLYEELFLFLRRKKAEKGILQASNIPENYVIDKAVLSPEPIEPKPMLNYLVCFFASIFLPVIIIITRDFMDTKIRTKEDLEKISNLPIVGVIGHNPELTNLVVFNHLKSPLSEAYRALRSNLTFLARQIDSTLQVVLFTSSVSGEGKTFTAVNFSSVLAISGKKTVLVGVDLRKPKIYNDFSLNNNKGVTNFLSGTHDIDEVIQNTGYSNLDLISAGPIPPNPSELIMNTSFSDMISELRKRYDYVILDTPPIGLVADSYEIMKRVDFSFYLVRTGYTEQNFLENVNELYEKQSIKNIAVIMNDYVRPKGYGYGYGGKFKYGYGNYGEQYIG